MSRPSSPAEKRVLAATRDLAVRCGWSPSARELAEHLGFSTGTIHNHLAALKGQHLVDHTETHPRRWFPIDPTTGWPLDGVAEK